MFSINLSIYPFIHPHQIIENEWRYLMRALSCSSSLLRLSGMSSLSTTPAHKQSAQPFSFRFALWNRARSARDELAERLGEIGTSEEAQPLGQDVGGFGLDQDLPAVQRHAGAHLPAHVEHGRLLFGGWEAHVQVRGELVNLWTHVQSERPLTASGT